MKLSPSLYDLVHAEFHIAPNNGIDDPSDDKAYFCVKCGGNSMTEHQALRDHQGETHKIIKAIKYKNHNRYCFKQEDVKSLGSDFLDHSWIHVYRLYSRNVYLLNSNHKEKKKKKNRSMKGEYGYCFCCGKRFKEMTVSSLFCSIVCKLECDENQPELNAMKWELILAYTLNEGGKKMKKELSKFFGKSRVLQIINNVSSE